MSNLRDQMANLTHDPGSPPPEQSPPGPPEERPLLRSFPNPSRYGRQRQIQQIKSQDRPTVERIKQYLAAEITTRWADLTLIACFFISGVIDAGAYNAYECFCSMQTGNTVFAALGVSNLPVNSLRLGWIKSVVSVLAFLAGSAATAFFHRRLGERKRWVLATSFFVQAVLITIAGVLVYRGNSSGAPGSNAMSSPSREVDFATLPADPGFPWADLIPIALLAFQAAAKVIASRVLDCGGLPCIVLTTLYADLISDPSFFSAGLFGNSQRNRRLGSAMIYFVGATIGGVAASHPIGFSGGLYIAAGLQFAVAIAWLLWRVEQKAECDDEEDSIAPGMFG